MGREPVNRHAWLMTITFCVVLSACTAMTQTPFQRMAGDAGGVLAASAETLTALNEGRLTDAYARASFVLYREALSGLATELPQQDGAPSESVTRELASRLADAERLVAAPCLTGSCDRMAQATTLREVSDTLLRAAER
jgi:hypothetical protein